MAGTNISALDGFISSLVMRKVADKNGDGKVTEKEKALFTYSDEAKGLEAKLYETKGDEMILKGSIDWGDVNASFKDLNKDLGAKQEAAALMYDLDTDKSGSVSYDEIVAAAADGNKDAQNLKELFGLSVGTTGTLDFSKMTNYIDLIDVNNDNSVSESETSKFGTLVMGTASRISIGGTEVNRADLQALIKDYAEKGKDGMTDLQMEFINQFKKGNYSDVAADSTWEVNPNMKITNIESFKETLGKTADNGWDDVGYPAGTTDVEFYNLDGTATGRTVIRAIREWTTGEEPNIKTHKEVLAEYRIPAGQSLELNSSTGETNLDNFLVGKGTESDKGSNAHIIGLLGGSENVTLVNPQYDKDGRLISFGEQNDTGATYQVSYNSDGTTTIIRSAAGGDNPGTTITTYRGDGKISQQKTFNTSGDLTGIEENTYDNSGNLKSHISNLNLDNDFPKISNGRIVFQNNRKIAVVSPVNATINANGTVEVNGKKYDSNGIEIKNWGIIAGQLAEGENITDFSVVLDSSGNIAKLVKNGKSYTFTYAENGDIATKAIKEGNVTTLTSGANTVTITDNGNLTEDAPRVNGMSIEFPANSTPTSVPLQNGDEVTIGDGGNVTIKRGSETIEYDKSGILKS